MGNSFSNLDTFLVAFNKTKRERDLVFTFISADRIELKNKSMTTNSFSVETYAISKIRKRRFIIRVQYFLS